MPNVKSKQRFPITDPSLSTVINNGAHGTFMCDATHPFDATLLVEGGQTKYSFAIKLFEDELGNPPVVANSITNGLLGLPLEGPWSAGTGFAVEAEYLSMTTGRAMIIMKTVTLKSQNI